MTGLLGLPVRPNKPLQLPGATRNRSRQFGMYGVRAAPAAERQALA